MVNLARTAACDPANFQTTSASVASRNQGKYDTRDVSTLLSSVWELLNSGAALTSKQLDNILALLNEILNESNVQSTTSAATLSNAALAVERLTDVLLARRNTSSPAFCPGIETEKIGTFADVTLQTFTHNYELNGAQFSSSSSSSSSGSDVAVAQLPASMFPVSSSGRCASLRTVHYSSALWFNPNGAYYYFNTQTLRSEKVVANVLVAKSRIISVRLPDEFIAAGSTIQYSDPIVLAFPKEDNDAVVRRNTDYICAWWDFTLEQGQGAWSTSGCRLNEDRTRKSSSQIYCECNHATHFAVLAERFEHREFSWIARIGLFILIGVLCIVLVSYAFRSTLHTENAALVMQYFGALLMTCVMLIIASFVAEDATSTGCGVVGIIMHGFFAAQAALIVMVQVSFALFLFGSSENLKKTVIHCSVLAWVMALGVVVLYATIKGGLDGFDHAYGDVNKHTEMCIMPSDSTGGWIGALLGPFIAAMIASVVLFVRSRRQRAKWLTNVDLFRGRTNQAELVVVRICFVLDLVMWLLGALTLFVQSSSVPDWLFLAVCVIHAVVIFRFYVLVSSKMRINASSPTPAAAAAATANGSTKGVDGISTTASSIYGGGGRRNNGAAASSAGNDNDSHKSSSVRALSPLAQPAEFRQYQSRGPTFSLYGIDDVEDIVMESVTDRLTTDRRSVPLQLPGLPRHESRSSLSLSSFDATVGVIPAPGGAGAGAGASASTHNNNNNNNSGVSGRAAAYLYPGAGVTGGSSTSTLRSQASSRGNPDITTAAGAGAGMGGDEAEFDDLIFALRSGALAPDSSSVASSGHGGEGAENGDFSPRLATIDEQNFELRRVSIADTHL